MSNCQEHQSKHLGCRARNSGPVTPQSARSASVPPTVAPWRSRALTDVLCLALIDSNATDAQAADHYALRCAELKRELMRLRERTVMPMRIVGPPIATGPDLGAPNGVRDVPYWQIGYDK